MGSLIIFQHYKIIFILEKKFGEKALIDTVLPSIFKKCRIFTTYATINISMVHMPVFSPTIRSLLLPIHENSIRRKKKIGQRLPLLTPFLKIVCNTVRNHWLLSTLFCTWKRKVIRIATFKIAKGNLKTKEDELYNFAATTNWILQCKYYYRVDIFTVEEKNLQHHGWWCRNMFWKWWN